MGKRVTVVQCAVGKYEENVKIQEQGEGGGKAL
jgi:hypothetical protein